MAKKKYPNIEKIEKILDKYFADDEEYQTKKMYFYYLDEAITKVNKNQNPEIYYSNIMSSTMKTVFVPNLEKIKQKIKDFEKEGKKKEAKTLKYLKNTIGVNTAAVTILSDKDKSLVTGYLVSEKFFNKMLNYIDFDENLENIFKKRRRLLYKEYNSNDKIKKLFDIYQFLRIHELLGHVDSFDLTKNFPEKYFKGKFSNIVFDLRIHALKEGILFPNLFSQFIEFFPNGIYKNTFRKSLAFLDIFYFIFKNDIKNPKLVLDNLDKLNLDIDFEKIKDIYEKIDWEKVGQNFSKGKNIVEQVNKKLDIYFKYYYDKGLINKHEIDKIELPLEKIQYFLEKYFKYHVENTNFIHPNSYHFEQVFAELSNFYEFLKREKNDGEGEGEPSDPLDDDQTPHDDNNERDPKDNQPSDDDIEDVTDEFDEEEAQDEEDILRRKRDEDFKEASKEMGKDLDQLRRGLDPAYYETKIDKKDLLLNSLLEDLMNILDIIKKSSTPTIIKETTTFTGSLPDYFERNFKEYLQKSRVYPEGFIQKRKEFYTPNPLIFTLIDNSGSMSITLKGEPLINLFKNAVLNTLCEKGDIPVINVDWDVEFKDLHVLNKQNPKFKEEVEKFMKFRGQGGTDNFGYFYANLDKLVEKNYDLFKEKLKYIYLTPEDLINRWKNGEVIVTYLSDGEFGNFTKELESRIEDLKEIFKNAKQNKIKPFRFIIPYNIDMKHQLEGLDPDLYTVYYADFKKLEKYKD